MTLNSIIFHTTNLKPLREFYEGKLGLRTGTYFKDGKELPDHSDSYVNYPLGGCLLCFEQEDGRTDLGTIVITVHAFKEIRARLEEAGVPMSGGTELYFKIKDPEGRTLIIEPDAALK